MRRWLEAGDLLAFLYTVVLARQAFWLLPDGAAWGATVALAGILGAVRLWTRRVRPVLPPSFWLGVAGPILVYWALHLPYPDVGFDVLNYHILHGERALRGLLALPGDFYPYYFPFLNPAPDTLTALLRALLGYRLGTIGGCLALLWTAALVYRALTRPIASPTVRALATLWIVCSEGLLWEVGNYMVDLYGLPLLLEATLLVLPEEEGRGDALEDLPLLGLLLGSAVAFKLTNVVFAAAIGVVFLGRVLSTQTPPRARARAASRWALGSALFVAPLVPHAVFLWWTTGSPLFPHYNSLFRSPLFPLFDIGDGRFGPSTRLAALAWPVLSVFQPERLSELGLTSGRLALGFLAALGVVAARPRDRRLVGLAAIVAVGGVLWSVGSGNHRYGVFAELVGGLVLALLAARSVTAGAGATPARRALAWVPCGLLAVQSFAVFACVASADWGGRPTGLRKPAVAWDELRRLGRDRDLARELPPDFRAALPGIGGWVDATPKTNGFMSLLSPGIPMIGLRFETLLDQPDNLSRFDEALRALAGRPVASIAFPDDLDEARTRLARFGFAIRREHELVLPFFSDFKRIELVALEIDPPPPLPIALGPAPRVPTAQELLLRRAPSSSRAWKEDDSLLGSIDEPAEGARVPGRFLVRGWARMPGEDLGVHVLLDGQERTVAAFRRTRRPDVADAYPSLGACATAGYEAVVQLTPEDAGAHVLSVIFRSRDGRLRRFPGRTITVVPGR